VVSFKKVGGQVFATFRRTQQIISNGIPTDRCKCPTKEITGAKKLNFVRKFSKNREFPAPNFAFVDEKFSEKKFSDNFLTAKFK